MTVIESMTTLHPLIMFLMMLAGIGLLIAEIYVVSFGLFGSSGLLFLIVGLGLLVATQTPWTEGAEAGTQLTVALALATKIVTAVIVLLSLLIGGISIVRSQRASWRRYADPRQLAGPDASYDAQGLERAEVLARITPHHPGKIFYRGTYWSARLASQKAPASLNPIEVGEVVDVVKWEGMVAHVESTQKSVTVHNGPTEA